MKTICLVRHAKSSWKNTEMSDIERPLNKRGERDAPFMASILKEKEFAPELILSSPALRAFTTAKIFAETLGYPENNIKLDINIYESGAKVIFKTLKSIEKTVSNVMLFGHNPDITYLASFLSGVYIDNIPTCGIVCIEFDVNDWKKLDERAGKLKFFEYPKKYNLPEVL